MTLPKPTILATDLDGTLIPIQREAAQLQALARLSQAFIHSDRCLIFATGRDLGSIQEAISTVPLPSPHWIIADVGVSIYRIQKNAYEPVEAYADYLRSKLSGQLPQELDSEIMALPSIQRQPDANQNEFKQSYYCAPQDLDRLTHAIREIILAKNRALACTESIDPVGELGLIDILPAAASKQAALTWLAAFAGLSPDAMIYAGDSGNDRSALTSGRRAIVVGNATPSLREDLQQHVATTDSGHHLYFAKGAASCGVLEGCLHFGLLDASPLE